MNLTTTLRFYRRNLPHWEVSGGRYFVTVRCAGSLPSDVRERLHNIARMLKSIEPRSSEFAALQRQYFATTEKYLDRQQDGELASSSAARLLVSEFSALAEWHVQVPHYTILPNHWHAIFVPSPSCRNSLGEIIKRVKGRSAHSIRQVIGGNGPVWQREWFDRWIRDEAEWTRYVAYIRANPVKAGFVDRWLEHPWTR